MIPFFSLGHFISFSLDFEDPILPRVRPHPLPHLSNGALLPQTRTLHSSALWRPYFPSPAALVKKNSSPAPVPLLLCYHLAKRAYGEPPTGYPFLETFDFSNWSYVPSTLHFFSTSVQPITPPQPIFSTTPCPFTPGLNLSFHFISCSHFCNLV